MAHVKLPPRQKMINMMYLVLTAILALNVSKEVLDAFASLDADLRRSERSLTDRSALEYDAFEEAEKKWPEKYRVPREQATTVRSAADSLVRYIETIKVKAISDAEGRPETEVVGRMDGRDTLITLMAVGRKDDRDALTRLLVGSEPADPKDGEFSASDLKNKLNAFRDQLGNALGDRAPMLAASLDLLFDFRDRRDASGVMNNWESINFYDVPLVAGIATLSRLQNDVRSAENDVVKWLYREVEGETYRFNHLVAAVIPQSGLVMQGDSFRADVFMAAYDDRNAPSVRLDVDAGRSVELPLGNDGKARLRLKGEGLGEQRHTGTIAFQGPSGMVDVPFEARYQVMAPLLVASPMKMNVLYRHVNNPIALSVPGVTAGEINAVITNGTITRAVDGWVAKPGSANDADVTALVNMPDGGARRIGPVHFRVKDLPPPMPYVARKGPRETTIKLTDLKAAARLIAKLENSEFDEPFKVVSFEFTLMHGGQPIPFQVRGGEFPQEMLQALGRARPNDKVHFEYIKAKLASGAGAEYPLPPISLKVVQ